jgi:hypothetical protein
MNVLFCKMCDEIGWKSLMEANIAWSSREI